MSAPARPAPVRASARQEECLRAILEAVRAVQASGRRPVVLLDIDDTILSTTRRHARILREFAGEPAHAARWPDAARLAGFPPPPSAYSVQDIASAAGVSDAGLVARLREFWFERFFKNEYLGEDEPVPGAPQYCAAMAEAGALLVYLTGRDEQMRQGTERALMARGFPAPGSEAASLVLKPRFDAPDLAFKAGALERVRAWGEVVAGFENEPAHINLFADAFPAGRMVLVETKHSGKPIEAYSTVGRIRDFVLTAARPL